MGHDAAEGSGHCKSMQLPGVFEVPYPIFVILFEYGEDKGRMAMMQVRLRALRGDECGCISAFRSCALPDLSSC